MAMIIRSRLLITITFHSATIRSILISIIIINIVMIIIDII